MTNQLICLSVTYFHNATWKQSGVHPWIPIGGVTHPSGGYQHTILPEFPKNRLKLRKFCTVLEYAPEAFPQIRHWQCGLCPWRHIFIFYLVCPAGQGRFKALHDCTACPPGTYHDGSVIEEPQYCMNCSINTFSPYTGAKVCQPCSSGFVTESTGAENCGKSFIHRTYVESQKISIFLGIFSFFGQKRVGVNLVLVLFCWLFLLYLNSLLQ